MKDLLENILTLGDVAYTLIDKYTNITERRRTPVVENVCDSLLSESSRHEKKAFGFTFKMHSEKSIKDECYNIIKDIVNIPYELFYLRIVKVTISLFEGINYNRIKFRRRTEDEIRKNIQKGQRENNTKECWEQSIRTVHRP